MGVQTKLPQAYMESHPEAAAALLERFPAAGIAATLTTVAANVSAGVLGRMAPAPSPDPSPVFFAIRSEQPAPSSIPS
jgi:hypothetical protein